MTNDTRQLMRKYEIRANKSLGQNFLINEEIIRGIVKAGDIGKSDGVIEVGPGLGAMTLMLGQASAMVMAVEFDRSMLPPLREVLTGLTNVEIVNEDILKTNITEIINKLKMNPEVKNIKVVSNLPYYITTPVIMRFLESESSDISMMEFMVQKEVAERICANPGGKDYGALTLAVRYYSSPEAVMNVSPDSFMPPPSVESTVVRLNMLSSPPAAIADKRIFFSVIKAAFSQRRKTLLNSLGNSGIIAGGKNELSEILNQLQIDEKIRGEALSFEDFANISNIVSSLK